MAEDWAGGRGWNSDDSAPSGSSPASEACTISTDLAPEGHSAEFGASPIADGGFQQSWSPREVGCPWNDPSAFAPASGDDQELFYYGVEHRNPAAEFFGRQAPQSIPSSSTMAPVATHHPYIGADPLVLAGSDALATLNGRSHPDASAVAAGHMMTKPAAAAVQPAMQVDTGHLPAMVQGSVAAWPFGGPSDPTQFIPQHPVIKQQLNLQQRQQPPLATAEQLLQPRRLSQSAASQQVAAESDPANTCPFCSLDLPNGKTRQRRMLKRERQRPKFGRWWRQAGYSGPKYCQRCSEVFRDHIMRQKPNSASCTRNNPCDDCTKVLRHFDKSGQVLWDGFDTRAASNKAKVVEKRKQHQLGESAATPPAQKFKT